MPAIADTLRKLNPWHKGKYSVLRTLPLTSDSILAVPQPTTCSSPDETPIN